MTRNNPTPALQTWTSIATGGVAFRPAEVLGQRFIELKVTLKLACDVLCQLIYLDDDRMELVGSNGGRLDETEVKLQVASTGDSTGDSSYCAATARRIWYALGEMPIFSGIVNVPVDETRRRRARYIGINLVVHPRDGSEEFELYWERQLHRLGCGIEAANEEYALLVSDFDANARIEMIARRSDLISPADPDAAEALTKLFYSIKGGYDTVLLKKDLENDYDD